MPAYSTVQTFIEALRTGTTPTTEALTQFFSDPERVRDHEQWTGFRDGNWSGGPPDWLSGVLAAPFPDGVGLGERERKHVLAWPGPELEVARAAAVRAVRGSGNAPARAPKFYWELYEGPGPRTEERVNAAGDPEIVFKSPRSAVVIEGDEIFVRDVPL